MRPKRTSKCHMRVFKKVCDIDHVVLEWMPTIKRRGNGTNVLSVSGVRHTLLARDLRVPRGMTSFAHGVVMDFGS